MGPVGACLLGLDIPEEPVLLLGHLPPIAFAIIILQSQPLQTVKTVYFPLWFLHKSDSNFRLILDNFHRNESKSLLPASADTASLAPGLHPEKTDN